MYNPFDKRIDDLSFDDIKSLQSKQVKEGFYIEYKSIFVDTLKVAHSIASFANTHGGWYFVGIDSDITNLPTGFPGFNLTDQPKPIEHLRNIIKDKINPFPRYFTKLIEIGGGKAILVVEIPESDETSHITKDGRIYRRNADGSDPVPESDRYVLDKLYVKSENLQREIERFCQREIVTSKAEEKNSYLEIYLMPYPLEQVEMKGFFEKGYVEKLKETMNETTKTPFSENSYTSSQIPFNQVAASWKSIVFRQANPGTLWSTNLTFELFSNGNAKIIIPFTYISHDTELESAAWNRLLAAMEEEDLSLFLFIDGAKVLSVFVTLLQKYFDILRSNGWQGEVLLTYFLDNTWRNVLFFDSESFVNHLTNYGVPMSQRESGWIPQLEKWSIINESPKNGIFHLVEFTKVLSHFGIFPQESPDFVKDWLSALKQEPAKQAQPTS